MKTQNSKHAFELAQQVIPGGVDSPVRAFKSVGGTPIFIEKGDGAYLFDIDGNKIVKGELTTKGLEQPQIKSKSKPEDKIELLD